MRAFIVMCFVAVACADQLGYNYQPVPHSASGLSFTPGFGSVGSGLSGGSFGVGNLVSHGVGSLGVGGGNRGGDGGPGFGNLVANAPPFQGPAELEKEFYTFSAPEGEFDDGNTVQRIVGGVKQGLRVIFIKGPENNGLENAAIALAKHASEQKTAIYVLNKQTDISELAHKLNTINKNKNNKPEVHFVKYRTPEDAANAQKAIQNQYDSLGGISFSHNGGAAPVLDFASQAPIHTTPAQEPTSAYLPSSIFRS